MPIQHDDFDTEVSIEEYQPTEADAAEFGDWYSAHYDTGVEEDWLANISDNEVE